MSNRPLRDGELFEIQLERMVERWSGSIEAGVTLIRPEDLDFPNTMTEIDDVTWMLSGSRVVTDGQTIRFVQEFGVFFGATCMVKVLIKDAFPETDTAMTWTV